MNDITKQIATVIGDDPVVESSNHNYTCFDTGGIETQVGEFLYGFVTLMRPQFICETGTYSGISAMYMALALRENGYGVLDTIEFEKIHYQRSKERFVKLGLQSVIVQHLMPSLEFTPAHSYDLLFLDTELNLRFHELVKLYSSLTPGGYVFIHDMPVNLCQENINPDHPDFKHWPVGEIPQQVKDWVNKGELRPMYFKNPRGMVGFYKIRQDEYKW